MIRTTEGKKQGREGKVECRNKEIIALNSEEVRKGNTVNMD